MKLVFVPMLMVLALVGCGETDLLVYEGRPAQSAAECQVALKDAQERLRKSPRDYSTRGASIGTALGRGMLGGMIDSAYQQCLDRVGSAGSASVPATEASAEKLGAIKESPSATTYGVCRQGGGVLQGGTGYCVGN